MTPKQLRKHKAAIDRARVLLDDTSGGPNGKPDKIGQSAWIYSRSKTRLTSTGITCDALAVTINPQVFGGGGYFWANTREQ